MIRLWQFAQKNALIHIYLQSCGNIEFEAYNSDVGGLWRTTAIGHIHRVDMIDGIYLQHVTIYTLGCIVQLFVLDLTQLDALDGLFEN